MDFIKSKIFVTSNKLDSLRTLKKEILDYEYTECPEYKKNNIPPSSDGNWKKSQKEQVFSGNDTHYWIHIFIPSIKKESGKELRLNFRTGREGQWDARNPQCIVYVNGTAKQAFDVNHTWLPLEYEKEQDIYIYLYTGLAGGIFLGEISLTTVDLGIESLYYDIKVPFSCLGVLDEKSYDYIKIRDSLDAALLNLDLRDAYSDGFYKSVEKTRNYLKTEFYEKLCGNSPATLSCIGHTHIDVAWLWPVIQTKEKAQRSFATALNLIDRYDSYKFMSSQPQLYKYIKQNDAEMYERIKKAVKNGKWEIEGAMWLESDTNLVSGESLIRQIMFGKKFIKDEFNIESKILWLPDVFGYSGALPQIMKKCNVDKFFTTKMEWNESNKMPNDVFIWEGIDGSKVYAAFEPSYSTEINPRYIFDFWNKFKNKSLNSEAILTFGFADGGGGSTAEMMEQYERLKYGLPGMPKTVIKTAGEYFEDSRKAFDENTEKLKKTPKWTGEMYLEMHRGTYTSMAKNKKNNRTCENLLMSLENLSAADMVLLGSNYPQAEINERLETVLLNQFHDIIPGSSIKEVYDVTDSQYADIIDEYTKLLDNAADSIISNLNTNGGIFIYNPSPFDFNGYVDISGKEYFAEGIPAHGWKVIQDSPSEQNVIVCDKYIENDLIKITFDENYQIVSVYDKEYMREVAQEGEILNRLEIFEDYPRSYDAWEITDYYKQKMWICDNVSDVTMLKNGLRIKRKYCNSVIEQDILINTGSKRIDFVTTVDWKEDHVLLKAAFPVDIKSDYATYDIQFGNVKRPTHQNTSWDAAKFEVCAHKWSDLSEGNYGVSLLNDCKYGYSTEDNKMSISLLKAASYPNPTADREVHKFTYSLLPHCGDYKAAISEGYKLNMNVIAKKVSKNTGNICDNMSLINCDSENIVVETIKKAEDTGDIIVRLYDSCNQKSNVKLNVNFDFKEAYICDMLENNLKKIPVCDKTVTVNVKNFEIVTIKFVR